MVKIGSNIQPLKFWCQKVLPLVYDDSLSYEELLCKVVAYLNTVIEGFNELPEYIQSLVSEDTLKEILSELLDELEEQIAVWNEGTSENATKDMSEGELVWLNGKLYQMTRNILAGDKYITSSSQGVTQNARKLTIENLIGNLYDLTTDEQNNLVSAINELVTYIGDLSELTTSDKSNLVSAINELDSEVGDLTNLTVEDKDNLVDAINEVDLISVTNQNNIGTLSDLNTVDKTSLVAAINEVANYIGNLENLGTEDKSNVVNAINEIAVQVSQISSSLIYTFSNIGLNGNGSSDNTTTFNAFLTEHSDENFIIVVDNGTYVFNNITIPSNVILIFGGGRIKTAGTVTLNCNFVAQLYQIFDGTGTFTVNQNYRTVGFPEWFGCTKNNVGMDCQPAIQKCIATFTDTVLSGGRYYINDTITIDTDQKRLIGQNNGWSDYWTTSIFQNVINKTIISIEGGANDVIDSCEVCGIVCTYTSTPNVYTRAVSVTRASHFKVFRMGFFNCADCLFINNTIEGRVYNCTVVYDSHYPTSQEGIGYHLGAGSTGSLGYAGQNASLFLNDINVSNTNLSNTTIDGILAHGAIADTFISDFECAGVRMGVRLESTLGASNRYYNNVYVKHPIIDNFVGAGIYVNGIKSSASIIISDGYFAPSANQEQDVPCIFINDSMGGIVIENNYIIGNYVTTQNEHYIGVLINSSSGYSLLNNVINNIKVPFKGASANYGKIKDIYNMSFMGCVNVVNLSNCGRVYIQPSITGGANMVSGATVQCDANCNYIEVNQTSINPYVATGNKLVMGTTAVTTPYTPTANGLLTGINS